MEIPVFTVDAFTNLPFKGNPAAVCLLLHELQDDMYQNIAAEMNLSETAFIIRLNSKDDFSSGARFRLRWFTPTTEVPLCGHATLASAAVLFYKKKNVNSTVVFETLSGELYVRQQGESIVMNFPLNKPTPVGLKEFKDIVKAAVGDQPVQEVCLCATTKMLMVRLADSCDRSVLTSLQPDPAVLLRVDTGGRVRGLLVTMIGDPGCQSGYDFYSRNFFPWFGVPEDPVTGYWSEKLGKKKMLAYQCSSRGGELELELQDDGRLNIAGQAVTVLQGILTV
ncbi:phenazine biosynthesis-like domain-containing protein 2 isoform X2 [Salvelinus namaycush]|uniref:Phenazine biosynthesis-like domain-containing protein 2 isoform X2 n=1 Tax=Salvelinus namaycush TaxID=8040 RepID=A0A8U0PUL7_SALNM|nr:phenazine biosynthesis-like domain-containing protein 2 isoform X2 [Salvelinus namaycush]